MKSSWFLILCLAASDPDLARSEDGVNQPGGGSEVQPVDEQTQRAIALEREVLAYRQSIQTIRADVTVKDEVGDDTRVWKLWAKGDWLRFDQVGGAIEAPMTVIKRDDFIFSRGFGLNQVTKELELPIASAYDLGWKGSPLFDLRMVGVVPVPTGTLAGVTEWEHPLARPDRMKSTIESARLDGNDAELTLITTVDLEGTRKLRLWIDTHKGPSLIRCEGSIKTPHVSYLDVYTTRVERIDDVWFPVDVNWQRFKNWFPLALGMESTTLSNIEVNQDVEDSVFSLEAMNVKPGDPVATPKGKSVWDGEKLISAVEPRSQRQGSRPSVSFRYGFMFTNLFVALGFVIRHFRKQKRSEA